MDTGECGTDQRLIAAHRDFPWPCEKRRSHGPHKRERINLWGPAPAVYAAGDGMVTQVEDCPGVKAHPATMIGR